MTTQETMQEAVRDLLDQIDPAKVVRFDWQNEMRELPDDGVWVKREFTGRRTLTIEIDEHREAVA